MLLNKANYLLEVLIWQKSKDAQKRTPRHRPKPFMPDFLKQPTKPSPINNGSEARTTSDVRSILEAPRG